MRSSSARLFQSLRAPHTNEGERKREALTYSETRRNERRTGRGTRHGLERETGEAAKKRERERERDGQYEQSETEERT